MIFDACSALKMRVLSCYLSFDCKINFKFDFPSASLPTLFFGTLLSTLLKSPALISSSPSQLLPNNQKQLFTYLVVASEPSCGCFLHQSIQ